VSRVIIIYFFALGAKTATYTKLGGLFCSFFLVAKIATLWKLRG